MPTQVENHAAGTASEKLIRANLINTACAGWVRLLINLPAATTSFLQTSARRHPLPGMLKQYLILI
jgi:hypothetical protein